LKGTAEIGTWVTVVGVIPAHAAEVVEHFGHYGIHRVDDTAGNWIYIEFTTQDNAKRAVDEARLRPLLVGGNMAVCCFLGKIKSNYLSELVREASAVRDPVGERSMATSHRLGAISGRVFDFFLMH
jgi:hypothetical protein